MSLDFVHLEKLTGDAASSPILDQLELTVQRTKDSKGKFLCTNCGAPTQFGVTALSKRSELGWCEPCFKHSLRTFKDPTTGETRYADEFRTVDGIKNRYGPH